MDIDVVIEEIINNKDFTESDIETKTSDNNEELRFPQKYENISIIILDDLNEKKLTTIKNKLCLNENVIIIYLFL